MDNNNVHGTLPEDWSALAPGLKVLGLGTNSISGSIPAGIANLTALLTLNLGLNKIVGSIPSLSPIDIYRTV